MGVVLYITPLCVIVEPPSLVMFAPAVAVVLAMLVTGDVIIVGTVKMVIVFVPCAGAEPQVVGAPEKVKLAGFIADAVIVCPDVAPAAISAVTQKYPVDAALITWLNPPKFIGLVARPVVTVLITVAEANELIAE